MGARPRSKATSGPKPAPGRLNYAPELSLSPSLQRDTTVTELASICTDTSTSVPADAPKYHSDSPHPVHRCQRWKYYRPHPPVNHGGGRKRRPLPPRTKQGRSAAQISPTGSPFHDRRTPGRRRTYGDSRSVRRRSCRGWYGRRDSIACARALRTVVSCPPLRGEARVRRDRAGVGDGAGGFRR